MTERFGYLKVVDLENNPRSGCYVKAFVSRNNEETKFYKDGYTDIRGRFDYVTLNWDILPSVLMFSILVVDD